MYHNRLLQSTTGTVAALPVGQNQNQSFVIIRCAPDNEDAAAADEFVQKPIWKDETCGDFNRQCPLECRSNCSEVILIGDAKSEVADAIIAMERVLGFALIL